MNNVPVMEYALLIQNSNLLFQMIHSINSTALFMLISMNSISYDE